MMFSAAQSNSVGSLLQNEITGSLAPVRKAHVNHAEAHCKDVV